ncbi:MAG: hypothetical protein IIC29_02785 [Chloroflexi bacterium]|nr:hypothetical protein [Chloroflexota bacterium]
MTISCNEEGRKMWNPGDWIADHKFTVAIVPIVIATIVAFPMVTFAPTWVSTTYVLALFTTPIIAVIWFFRSM